MMGLVIYEQLLLQHNQKIEEKRDLTFRKRCKNMMDAFQECNLYVSFERNEFHTLYDYK